MYYATNWLSGFSDCLVKLLKSTVNSPLFCAAALRLIFWPRSQVDPPELSSKTILGSRCILLYMQVLRRLKSSRRASASEVREPMEPLTKNFSITWMWTHWCIIRQKQRPALKLHFHSHHLGPTRDTSVHNAYSMQMDEWVWGGHQVTKQKGMISIRSGEASHRVISKLA